MVVINLLVTVLCAVNKENIMSKERYCEIRCKSLEDIRDDMQERMWHDLLEDVTAMLNKEKE